MKNHSEIQAEIQQLDDSVDALNRIAELEGLLDFAVRELTDIVDDIEDTNTYTQRRAAILLQQLEKGVDISDN